MNGVILSILISTLDPQIVEVTRPVEIVVVVLSPDDLPPGTSISAATERLTHRLSGPSALRSTTLAQLGLLDPVLDACPRARLLSCWGGALSLAARPPRYGFIVSLRVQRAGTIAARAIILPISPEDSGDDPLLREQALQQASGRTDWLEAQWPTDLPRTLDQLYDQLEPWLRARGLLDARAELRLEEVPVGASVRWDDEVLVARAQGGRLSLRAVPAGSHRIEVRSEAAVWTHAVELASGDERRLRVRMPSTGLRAETVLGWGGLTLGVTAGVVAAVAAAESSPNRCLPALGEASCPSGWITLGGGEEGLQVGEQEGFPVVPVAFGLTAGGLGSLLLPRILPETCEREPVWCQLGAWTAGALLGLAAAAVEP